MLMTGCTATVQTSTKAHENAPPMVISLGWSSPDPRYLRLHSEEWENRPFTGTLVHLYEYPYAPGGCVEMGSGRGLSWSAFQNKRFTPKMLDDAIADLKATKLTRAKDNFLWVVSYIRDAPRHFDWYDETRWATVLHNIEGLARVAKEGGLKGIVLDCEEYGCAFWSWSCARPDYVLKNVDIYKDKTWEQTSALVRQRGRSLIRAINKAYPGCLIWTLYGYSHIEMKDDEPPLSDSDNGLYARFLDGMIEASDENTLFIDGCEGAYRYGDPNDFMSLRRRVTEKALKYTLVPEAYKRKIRVGFGLYMDMYNYPGNRPWYGDRPQDNYRTPEYLEKSLRNAIQYSDGYVWIYSEYPSWWLENNDAQFGEGVVGRKDHYLPIPRVYWKSVKSAIASSRTGAGLKP